MRTRQTWLLAILLISLRLLTPPASWAAPITAYGLNGNLVVNPSFEDSTVVNVSLGYDDGITGWNNLSAPTFDFHNTISTFYQPEGVNSGDQEGGFYDGEFQTIVGTKANQHYLISFYLNTGNIYSNLSSVSFGGLTLSGEIITPSPYNSAFTLYSYYDVVAPVDDSVLQFITKNSNTVPSYSYAILDDVSVSLVPEIEARSWGVPLALVSGILLLAWDKRRIGVPA